MLRKLQNDIETAESDYNIISIKLKEKEQESRLNDFKINELKRGLPHKKLKPLNTDRNVDRSNQKALTQYPSNQIALKQPFEAPGLSKVKSHTQFKISKLKRKVDKLPKIVNQDIVLEEVREEHNEVEISKPKPESSMKSESHSSENEQDNYDILESDKKSKNETENINKAIKHKKKKKSKE